MTQPAPEPMVLVGRITAPVGLRGDVRVEAASDVPHRFAPGSPLWIDGVQHRVVSRRTIRRGLVLHFANVDSHAGAEALRGKAVEVPIDQVPPLPQGSFYFFELLDLDVFTPDGEYLGKVAEILPTGSNDVYVVRRGKQEVLVPALDDVVLDVDVPGGRMTVSLPEGLLPS